MKKRRTNTYDLILANELSGNDTPRSRKSGNKKLVLSKSLDDGEVLVRKEVATRQEYVVEQSASFEEYVVELSSSEHSFEEYVVTAPADYAGGSASKTFSVELVDDAPQPSTTNDDRKVQEEYETDLMEPGKGQAPPPPVSAPQSTPETSMEFAETYTEKDTKAAADEDDFINDMKAILSGEKTFDPVTKKAVDSRSGAQSRPQAPPASGAEANDGHAIFKKIAENMQYANAYDLGTVELENRFADFDRIEDIRRSAKRPATQSHTPAKPAPAVASEMQVDSADFIQDLDAINALRTPVAKAHTDETTESPDSSTAAWPPRPSTIRPYTHREKIAAFGEFAYEADPDTFGGDGIRVTDNWKQQNIINVAIPQLNGKRMGSTTITNGSIRFHKNGAEQLRALWAAWEQAGLLDRILTYEGGYAARFIRGTQSRDPRPLSNHAWGTAFDINARWNRLGAEPALLNHEGCVRELVSIANSHGFFWGGHFRGKKDGMHFELGKIL